MNARERDATPKESLPKPHNYYFHHLQIKKMITTGSKYIKLKCVAIHYLGIQIWEEDKKYYTDLLESFSSLSSVQNWLKKLLKQQNHTTDIPQLYSTIPDSKKLAIILDRR